MFHGLRLMSNSLNSQFAAFEILVTLWYNIYVMSQTSISVATEIITKINIGPYHIDVTNSMLTCAITCAVLIVLGFILGQIIPKDPKTKPNKIQTFIELIGHSLNEFILSVLKLKKVPHLLFGICGFFFAYIAIGSWIGLIPGVGHLYILNPENNYVHLLRASTSDLSGTVALSVIAFSLIQLAGLRKLKFNYLGKFINFSSPMNFFVGILELISEASRLLSFALRLFGNIFAGEVMLKIVTDLTKFSFTNFSYIGVPIPSLLIALEFFVALIQAYVFIALFLVFSSQAQEEAH
jgi:F-type H+-transporting ATPase subunit a